MQGRAHPACAPPPKIGKNTIFLRKIVIFHKKYPKNFRTSRIYNDNGNKYKGETTHRASKF